jgi:hypothetical protein
MEVPLEQQPSDSAESDDASNETIRLIRKLRWVGMDEEAERLLKNMQREHIAATDSVLAASCETD